MADYYPGDIEIGGKLPHSLLEEFINVLLEDGVQDDGSMTMDSGELQTYLKESHEQKLELKFTKDSASYGSFPAVEDWCRKHGLSYCRHSEAKYEYDAEQVWWKPDMKEPKRIQSDQGGGDSYISVEDIQKCLKGNSAVQQVKRLKKLIADNAPAKIPPLEITGVPDEAATVS